MVLQLNKKRKLALVLLALSSCVVTFAAALAASDESADEKSKRLKRSAQTMRNLCVENAHPQVPLVLRPLLDIVFNDPGRNYCRTQFLVMPSVNLIMMMTCCICLYMLLFVCIIGCCIQDN
jgi:hypothetical protein